MSKKLLNIGIGALPVGLKGKMYSLPFKVLIQYEIDGKVKAQIYEDTKQGNFITDVSGNKKNIPAEVNSFFSAVKQYAINFDWNNEKFVKQVHKDITALIKQLSSEVNDYNTGTNTKTTKPEPVIIEPPKKMKRAKLKRKKKDKGAIIKYIDEKGTENKTYKVKRNKSGEFIKFIRVAGKRVNRLEMNKPHNTEIGAFKYSDSDLQAANSFSKLVHYWDSKGFKDYSSKFRKPQLKLARNFFSQEPYNIIINKYKFKHIEFGNWVTNEDRFNYLLQFIIALHDLNLVCKFHDNLGLFNTQSIAFGARGAGSALAHYEYWNGYINLTRYKRADRTDGDKDYRFTKSGGIGSFAHEYGHALDFFFAQFIVKKAMLKTLTTTGGQNVNSVDTNFEERDLRGTDLRAQMQRILFKCIWKKYDWREKSKSVQTQYYMRLRMELSKDGQNDYWIRRVEIWARLFEQYIQHKLKQKNIYNVFLAKRKYDDSRYLPLEEFKPIVPMIDKLMAGMAQVLKRKSQ